MLLPTPPGLKVNSRTGHEDSKKAWNWEQAASDTTGLLVSLILEPSLYTTCWGSSFGVTSPYESEMNLKSSVESVLLPFLIHLMTQDK